MTFTKWLREWQQKVKTSQLQPCPWCGTNGAHYCPHDVDRGPTDPVDDYRREEINVLNQ